MIVEDGHPEPHSRKHKTAGMNVKVAATGWRIIHTDCRRPLKTFQETVSTVIALQFYATA
ncbi:hypothetical protein [Streptomyces sp. NPDC057199]|uniref:hypothetical protein n=1 Tax=Streptomyces sp. NPDC057199 TaxID=3346047 RepID=UPI00363E586F